MLQETS